MTFTKIICSRFKEKVENSEIDLRAQNEKNWPSFLYPDGTIFDPEDLDKGLFRGHVFIRVGPSLYCSHTLITPPDFAHDLHRKIISLHRLSLGLQAVTG